MPAYNTQIATDPGSRAIVAVDVTNHGTDHGEDQPLRAQIERRTGQHVRDHLMDNGYVALAAIDRATAQGVTIFAPLPTRRDGTCCTRRSTDSPAVAAWRERMTSPAGRAVYALRAQTSETINADLKTHRGLASYPVRGLVKCRCIALWAALAYNLIHFAERIATT